MNGKPLWTCFVLLLADIQCIARMCSAHFGVSIIESELSPPIESTAQTYLYDITRCLVNKVQVDLQSLLSVRVHKIQWVLMVI